jgi:hypothetical protein
MSRKLAPGIMAIQPPLKRRLVARATEVRFFITEHRCGL